MIKSPFSSRSPKDFRILQLYPNVQMSSLMPQSIGIFSALFKNEGYTDAIFDCTYYQDVHFNDDDSISEVEIQNTNDVLVENRAVPNFNTEELLKKGGAPKKGSNIKHDFIRKVNEFKPDLILVSVVESTYFLAIDLLRSIPEKDRNYKTLLGGVFPTYAADKVIKNELVDYVCRGEGEEAIFSITWHSLTRA
tara:strand:- start:5 stop:583 length:579 start_codon:yes stop_codon:yes gene_type:complete